MRIANNIPALTTLLTLRATDQQVVGAMRRLSTGSKINSAKDDPAGLSIANKLGIQISGLNRASQNSMDGVSLIQTADGSLDTVTNIIQRMRELAIQAAGDVLEPSDKSRIQLEINQLIQEINDNAYKTEFNRIKILNGEAHVLAQSLTSGGAPGDGVASVLYTGASLPPGHLRYTIDSPGLPAEIKLDPNALLGSDVTFRLNEVSVSISANDSPDDIRGKLGEAAELAALEIKYSGGVAFLANKAAGAEQTIDLTSTAMPAINARSTGTDAALSHVEYENSDGTPNAEFNSNVSVRSDGNQVTVAGPKGQIIRLGVKVFFSPAGTGPSGDDFVYGDGTYSAAAPPPYSDGTPVASAVDMVAVVKDYGPLYLQVGPNFNQHMPVSIPQLDSETLGFIEYTGGAAKIILDLGSTAGANKAISILDKALAGVTEARAWIGAYQNRLEQTVMNLDSASINMESARSRIQDTDMAYAMTEYTQFNVKYQAGIAILAQANQRPQQILSLLQ
ncbi:MAG: hypothetical protein LBB94_02330 [Clostridiales bacterium]|nr:hypothetical protein [Clostridiales bacterium]